MQVHLERPFAAAGLLRRRGERLFLQYQILHRLALSSSTVIQALELGKPVLVPDRGLLGWRVREHGLGGTYAYEDIADLQARATAMWQDDLSGFQRAAQAFWPRFSDAAIAGFFRRRLLETA